MLKKKNRLYSEEPLRGLVAYKPKPNCAERAPRTRSNPGILKAPTFVTLHCGVLKLVAKTWAFVFVYGLTYVIYLYCICPQSAPFIFIVCFLNRLSRFKSYPALRAARLESLDKSSLVSQGRHRRECVEKR